MTKPNQTGVADRYRYEELRALMTRMTGDEKHTSSATSTLDVLWVLYDRVLCVAPSTMDDPDRDRFLLSKGHGPMAYYAVLAAKGFIPVEWLDTFGQLDSPLGYHPDRVLIPGAEISSGSLGHGLPIAVGVAVGQRTQRTQRTQGSRGHTFVLVGDAELDEGTNHEAIVYAGAAGLDGLTAIVVDNQSATHGWPGGISARFSVNGWSTATVDGRDHEALEAALTKPVPGHPHVVVAVVEPKE